MNTTKVSRVLAKWCREAHDTERRTVVVRLNRSADIERLEAALGRDNGYVESSGHSVVTVVVSARDLSEVSRLVDVLSIDEPRELHPVVNIVEAGT